MSEMTATSAANSFAIALDRCVEVRRADLFLAFHHDFQIDRQRSARVHVCVDGGQMHHDLSLVVDGAASEDLAVAHVAFERRRLPQIERVDRLHVVVAVNEHGRLPGRAEPLAVCQRIAAGLELARIESGLAHAFDQPVATASDLAALFRIGAYRRDGDEPLEFGESALLFALAACDEVRIDDGHDAGSSTKGAPNCTSSVLPPRSISNECGLPS